MYIHSKTAILTWLNIKENNNHGILLDAELI